MDRITIYHSNNDEFNKSIRKSALYQTSLLNKYHLKTLTNKYCLDFCAFDVSKTYIRFIFENGWSGEKTSIAVTNINTFLKGSQLCILIC